MFMLKNFRKEALPLRGIEPRPYGISTVVLQPKYYDLEIRRDKRYVIRGKRWKKHKFRWQLSPENLLEHDIFIVRNTLHRAMNEWSKVSSVEFEEIPIDEKETNIDLQIGFEKGNHGDGYEFDGKDGVVAHAFYPRDGRLHFDADEQWSLNTDKGVNLYQTAVHEIGHLLGLEHSIDNRAAMFAAKRPYDPNFGLGDDDVRAIRNLFPIDDLETTPDPEFIQKEMSEEQEDPFETTTVTPTTTVLPLKEHHPSSFESFFPFPLPSLEHFQRRTDWFVH
ncbi:unnamed protein product [Caenorhabditis angaria]|uniref:Peptidase metallopeptidase domain-containing protein n=1 Tax=Caenorhabditis angaria TaxID=860376 RepID=A0A9P1INE4_9PELO|nr:unnamed protein product [Caenorhabditis angaria]